MSPAGLVKGVNNTTTKEQPFSERVPPHNIEAEQSVLGACLIDGAAAQAAAEILKPANFYADKHSGIYDAILAVMDRGDPTDLITVQAELRTRNKLDEIGGLTYLTSIMNMVPTTANITAYAGLVAEASRRRRFIESARRAIGTAEEDHRPLDEALMIVEKGITEAQTTNSPGTPIRTLAELETLPPAQWLIERYIPEGAFAVLYGASGVGKSFLAQAWALHVATGRPWMDTDPVQGLTVYIAAEGATGISRRVRAWMRAQRVDEMPSARFVTEAINFADDATASRFIADIGRLPEKPRLVIIDTLARAMPGADENSARDVGIVISNLDKLRQATGCAVLVLHHSGKAGTVERGSSALRAASDAVFALKEEDGTLTLTVEKQKDSAPAPPLRLRLVPTHDASSCLLVRHNALPTPKRMTDTQQMALERLVAIGEASYTAWMRACNLPNSTFNLVLQALCRRGSVEATGSGRDKIYRPIEEDV